MPDLCSLTAVQPLLHSLTAVQPLLHSQQHLQTPQFLPSTVGRSLDERMATVLGCRA